VITAGAGALTITATAIAKKKEQEAQEAQALADLQAQQALQAQTAIANWDENIQKQADALEAVIVAGKQSQANKNYWAAYAIWQAKVAEARARRRAAEKARLEALRRVQKPLTASAKPVNARGVNPLALLLAIMVVGFALLLGTVQTQSNTKPTDFERPITPTESQAGKECLRIAQSIPWIADDVFCMLLNAGETILNFETLRRGATDLLANLGIGTPSNAGSLDEQVTEWTAFSDVMTEDLINAITETDTNTQDNTEPNECNPEEFAIWWDSLALASAGTGLIVDREYEQRVARGIDTMGTTRKVPAGDETINADGANPHNCFLIEAKHARNPNNPSWQEGRFYGILDDVDDEFRRYHLAMQFNPHVRGLEVRTNSLIAKDYFESRLAHYGFLVGVNAVVIIYP